MTRFDNDGVASWTLPIPLMYKYKTCQHFIETGTYKGGTVQQALDVGFTSIFSVERDDFLFGAVRNRFKDNPYVTLYHGNSGQILPDILDAIGEGEALIWLDAHWFNAVEHDLKLVKDESGPCPLIQELTAIRDNGTPNHVIMIDDMKMLQKGTFDNAIISMGAIYDLLKQINPMYKFTLYDSNIQEKDILVASIW